MDTLAWKAEELYFVIWIYHSHVLY